MNTEIRILITNNFPALIVLLQAPERDFDGSEILRTQVLPLFYDLVEDSEYLVRAACAQVLPTMCNLIWQETAAELL